MNNRDWQADKQTWDEFNNGWFPGGASNNRDAFVEFAYFAMDALPYWLQQYAVWKAKAYEAEVKAHEAESREKKLKEAIETAIKEKAVWGDAGNALDVVVRYLGDTLTALYTKEEPK